MNITITDISEKIRNQRLSIVQNIVKNCQYQFVDEDGNIVGPRNKNAMILDLYSAAAILSVHDNVSEEHREKLLSMPLPKMASVSLQAINSMKKGAVA